MKKGMSDEVIKWVLLMVALLILIILSVKVYNAAPGIINKATDKVSSVL